MLKVIYVGFGGFIGSILRYSLYFLTSNILGYTTPVATLFVNIIGCFLIGCATSEPITLTQKQIESICHNKKIEATKPTTNLSLATGSDGPKYQIGITMSSDYIAGRDPNEVYEQCLMSFSL